MGEGHPGDLCFASPHSFCYLTACFLIQTPKTKSNWPSSSFIDNSSLAKSLFCAQIGCRRSDPVPRSINYCHGCAPSGDCEQAPLLFDRPFLFLPKKKETPNCRLIGPATPICCLKLIFTSLPLLYDFICNQNP